MAFSGIFLHFALKSHLTKTKKPPWERHSMTFPASKASALARGLSSAPFHLTIGTQFQTEATKNAGITPWAPGRCGSGCTHMCNYSWILITRA